MTEEVKNVEVIQGAEFDTAINEKGTTLSAYKTSRIGAIAEYTARFDTQSLEGGRYNSRRIATSDNNKL
jgi:hypothetical protein